MSSVWNTFVDAPTVIDNPQPPPPGNPAKLQITAPSTYPVGNYNHYVTKAISPGVDGYWVSFDVNFPRSYLDVQKAWSNEDPIAIASGDSSVNGGYWVGTESDPTATTFPADAVGWLSEEGGQGLSGFGREYFAYPIHPANWYTIQFYSNHPAYGDTHDYIMKVDGTILPTSASDFSADTTLRTMFWGLLNYSGSGASGDLTIYLKNMKIGTTEGGKDIFDGTTLTDQNWPFDGSPDDDPFIQVMPI